MVSPKWSQNPDRTQPFSEHIFGQTLCSLPPWSNSSNPLRPPSSWRERSRSSTRLHPSSHDASLWRSSARRCAAAAPRSVVSWGSPRSSGSPLEGPEEGGEEIAGLVLLLLNSSMSEVDLRGPKYSIHTKTHSEANLFCWLGPLYSPSSFAWDDFGVGLIYCDLEIWFYFCALLMNVICIKSKLRFAGEGVKLVQRQTFLRSSNLTKWMSYLSL